MMVRGWILQSGVKSARVGMMEALCRAKCEEEAVRAKTRALQEDSKRLKLALKGRAGHEGAEKDPWRAVQADECQYRAWNVWANSWPSYSQPGSCDHVSEGSSQLREARKRWFGAELVAQVGTRVSCAGPTALIHLLTACQPVKDLLRDYGLALVATHAPQSPVNRSLLAVTATIAIPRPDVRAPALSGQASHSGTDSDSDSPGEEDGLAAGPSAPAAFRLPDDADGRFRRFLREFAVGCVPRGVSPRKRGEGKEERTRRREAAAAEARQPSFFRAGADSIVLGTG